MDYNSRKEHEDDTNCDGEVPFDNEGQQTLGDASFDLEDQKHNFDPMALEDAMKELYIGQVHKVGNNNTFYELVHSTQSQQ
jgi:hypothetical protein